MNLLYTLSDFDSAVSRLDPKTTFYSYVRVACFVSQVTSQLFVNERCCAFLELGLFIICKYA